MSAGKTSRRDEIFAEVQQRQHAKTDRMFAKLLVAQWVFAIVLALLITPYSYEGSERSLHLHVKAALLFGGLVNALPLLLVYVRPGWWGTRHTIAAVQMVWSALLIMITGGRIETHFHVFGSLAFVAFYRDWKLLPTATMVVAIDHLARGLWWPDSVYGTLSPEWWRFIEHASWVVFEDIVLAYACVRGVQEMRAAATREACLEEAQAATERQVIDRTYELQRTMERYRSLVENTAAIPFEIDLQSLETKYVAPQAAKLFECTLDELADNNFLWSMIHQKDVARVAQVLAEFACDEHSPTRVIDLCMVTRTSRTLHLRAFLSDRDGERIRGIVLDVTQQKWLEAELQQAQKLESVGRLASGVAHEINTPIQFVGDSLEFIREAVGELIAVTDVDKVDPFIASELPAALDRAADGIDRVAVIVRSMKVFAHSSGEHAKVDLNRALQSTLAIARNEYKYVADIDVELGDLPSVWCHGGEINQLLLNLVLNAAHAIADRVKGTDERGTISVRTRRDVDSVVISIGDTGTGIPDTIRDRIFDPFFTTKPVGRGSGQGLSIARAVVDKHRGTITFDTEVGRGSTFHVRVPIDASAQVEGKVAA